MPNQNELNHQIKLTKAHLELISEYVEATHRAICGDYNALLDLIATKTDIKLSYEEKQEIQENLRAKLQPGLEWHSSYSGIFDALGYQTYRDVEEYLSELRGSNNVYSHKMLRIAKEPKMEIGKVE